MILKNKKDKSLSTLVKELDTVFSLFIRLRDADESGTVTCFVTGDRLWYLDCDAAHYHVRAKMGTRWDEMNVHATSSNSNRFDDNHYSDYIEAMKKKYSVYELKMLSVRANSLLKATRNELTEMIEEYKVKVSELKRIKGL